MSMGLKAVIAHLEAKIKELEQTDIEKDFALKAKIDTFKAVIDLLSDDLEKTQTYDDFFIRPGVEL